LEQLERLEPLIVVPGHGEVGDAGLITGAREYLMLLRSETRRLAGEGGDEEAIVAELAPRMRECYPEWEASEWIAFGVRAFLAE
jgi:hypothetical protein